MVMKSAAPTAGTNVVATADPRLLRVASTDRNGKVRATSGAGLRARHAAAVTAETCDQTLMVMENQPTYAQCSI